MSEARGLREDPSAPPKRGVGESPGVSDMAKVKQQSIFVSKKYDGFGDSLVTANLSDVKYGSFTEGIPEGNAYIASISESSENSELQELSFLNLTGVSPAEQDILHSIIHDSKWYSESLFCLMRSSPSPGDPNVVDVDSSDRCLTETGVDMEGDGIPEVSGDPDNIPGNIADEVPHLQNGPTVDMSQPHLNPVDEGGMPGVMSSGVPPSNMRPYYSNPPHLAVSTTGPPPTSVQLPVSGGQMMMYPNPQQLQQLMQSGHGGYSMQPVGYPSLHYGYPQHGAQPHVTYVSPTGETLSPESVHMGPPPQQTHPKSHHDAHHGMTHTPSNAGPGGYAKSRNPRRDNVKQQQQQQQQHHQQQPFYYHSYGYPPAGMHYHSHQQLAQNVTGSPIIMQTPHGNIYPYHQPPQTMYPQQNTAVPGEMEHHQSNVGMPQHMSHVPAGEIPSFAQQQHHHVGPGPMYHHSPTHAGSNRTGNYSQSSRGNPAPLPVVEHPVTPISTTSEIQPETDNLDAEKAGEGNFSQSAKIAVGQHSRDNTEITGVASSRKESEYSQKKSLINQPAAVLPAPVPSGATDSSSQKPVIVENNVEPLSESSRDTEIVDRIDPPTEKLSKGASGRGNSVAPRNSQPKSTPSTESSSNADNVVLNYKDTPSVNGDIKDIKPGKAAPRDKLSAEPAPVAATVSKKDIEAEARQPGNNTSGKPSEAKFNNKSPVVSVNVSNSSRSVNVVSNSSSVAVATSSTTMKDISEKVGESSESASGEFPQLSANSTNASSTPGSLPSSSSSSSGHTAAAKGRSWASIASVKSQSDGANQKRMSGASIQMVDQGSGDSAVPWSCGGNGGRLMGGQQYSNFVPSCQNERSLAKLGESDYMEDSSIISDENDPVALALGEFLSKYRLDHHSIALTPRGLCNQGNYCYINATLQALLACPPLVNLFRAMGEILNKRPCRSTPIIQNVFELVSEFEPLLRGNANKKERMKDVFNVGPNMEPLGIRKCLGLLEGSTFKVEGRQEDAEEFLSHLLNGLHDEMLKVMKWAEQRSERGKPQQPAPNMLAAGQGATNGGGVEFSGDEDDDQWQVMGAKNKSCLTRKTAVSKTPVSEAFLGQMCYFYRESSTGSHKSATHQPFYTLQLDIQNDNIRSVRDALEAISAREEVSGVVSASGSEVEAWRQLSLEELPVVLILHLKRFVYEQKGNKIRKIDKKLDFGIDLDIGRDMLSPSARTKYGPKQRQYKLFGVVYHDGEEAHKGHYVADCFHASGGSMWGQCGWLRFDDTAVKQIPESQMLNPLPPRVPYLLYYRRGDTLLSHVTQQQQQHKKDRP